MARDERRRGPEDEGIPDLQDGTPEQEWSEDPEEMPLPSDTPVSEDYGTTASEASRPEPLDSRLAREEPDPASRLDLETGAQTAQPGDVTGREAAGRLVAPADEGRPLQDEEGYRMEDGYATDEGENGGGFSAEEDAVRITDDPRPGPVFSPDPDADVDLDQPADRRETRSRDVAAGEPRSSGQAEWDEPPIPRLDPDGQEEVTADCGADTDTVTDTRGQADAAALRRAAEQSSRPEAGRSEAGRPEDGDRPEETTGQGG